MGDTAFALGKGFTSTVGAGNVATNDFFTAFSNNSVNLNLTLSGIGGQRQAGGFGDPTIEAHSYLIFVF